MVPRRNSCLGVLLLMLASSAASSGGVFHYFAATELLQEAQSHDRTIVVVEGRLHVGRENRTLFARPSRVVDQDQAIWLEDIEYIKANERRWPDMRRERATQEMTLSAADYKRYRRLFKLRSNHFPTVVLKGEFQTSREPRFGHLSAFRHRLIVYEVICIREEKNGEKGVR